MARALLTKQQAKRFHEACEGGCIYVPDGRINFESGLGKKGRSPAFGSCVMKLQNGWEIKMISKNDLINERSKQHENKPA